MIPHVFINLLIITLLQLCEAKLCYYLIHYMHAHTYNAMSMPICLCAVYIHIYIYYFTIYGNIPDLYSVPCMCSTQLHPKYSDYEQIHPLSMYVLTEHSQKIALNALLVGKPMSGEGTQ